MSTESAQALVRAVGIDAAEFSVAMIAAFERIGVLLAVKESATGRYLHAAVGLVALLGHGRQTLVGANDAELMEPAQSATMRAAEQAAAAQGTPIVGEHRIDLHGQRRDFEITRLPLPGPAGGPSRHVLALWVERTDKNRREQQLRQALLQLEQQQVAVEALRREVREQPARDGATVLYQRRNLDEQLRREIDLSSREHREFALVSIALDPLDPAARSLGNAAQARVLEALERLLRSNTRAMDASCRLDDERFALLLSGVGLATAHARMEGLRRQCATQIVVLDGRDLGFTVSMGVASFPHTAPSEVELMRASETALADACGRGGNLVALASIRFELAGR